MRTKTALKEACRNTLFISFPLKNDKTPRLKKKKRPEKFGIKWSPFTKKFCPNKKAVGAW